MSENTFKKDLGEGFKYFKQAKDTKESPQFKRMEESIMPKNEGSTPPAKPVGNERTYTGPTGKEVKVKKSWWPW